MVTAPPLAPGAKLPKASAWLATSVCAQPVDAVVAAQDSANRRLIVLIAGISRQPRSDARPGVVGPRSRKPDRLAGHTAFSRLGRSRGGAACRNRILLSCIQPKR